MKSFLLKISRTLAAKKKIFSLFFCMVFTLSISAQVYYLLPNSDDANCENITNQYDHPTNGNRLQWETSEGNAPQCPERNAFDWFARIYCDASIPWIYNKDDHQIRRIVTFKDLTDGRLAAEGNMFNDVKVIWVNVDRKMDEAAFDAMFPEAVRTALANYVKAGGNLYLSTFAARLAYLIERAPALNEVKWNNDFASAGDEWKLTAHFKKEGDGSYDVDKHGHAIFKYLRDNKLYADDYHFHMQKGSPRTDRNCLWNIDDNITAFNNFQNDNTCGILGSWGHTAEFLCAGLVEFYPVGDWKGTIITNGLAACSFASANTDRFCVEHLTRGILDYLKARPCDKDNKKSMEEKLAEDGFYPDNTTTFRTLHPDCEGLSAAYSLKSNPGEIARIEGNQLQFKEAGTVTLHITLTENREFKNWPKGTYEYDRAITFSYAENAAQVVVNNDLSGTGIVVENDVQMAMRLHPKMRSMDSLSYTIENHYDNTGGEAYKETKDGVTRLYFSKSGKVLLTVRLNEPNEWVEAWPVGEKELTRVVKFDYTQEDGPVFPWPSEFETGAVGPSSVITLPETVAELPVSYSIEEGDDATLDGRVLTLANVTSGKVTVHASVTENDFKLTWPKRTYTFKNKLSFHAAEVGYLLPAAESIDHLKFINDPDYQGQQPEYNAAKWFEDNYITCANPKGRFVTVDELPTLFAKGIKTLWVNIERVNINNTNGLLSACLADKGLETYIKAGGNVLLTKQATRLAFTMERISYAPDFNAGGYIEDNKGYTRSIATKMGTKECVDEARDMSGHRLYEGMLSWEDSKYVFLVAENCKKTYNYCSWRDFFRAGEEDTHYDNCLIRRLSDFEKDWNATVFGIQGGIGDYCYSDVVEFNATGDWKGRILTIGSAAYQWGSSNNLDELGNMKRLTSNALAYLNNEEPEEEVYTRSVTNGNYGTICLPMASAAIEGATMYRIADKSATGITIEEVAAMEAGTPYIFQASADEIRVTMTGQSRAVQPANGLVGNLGEENITVPQGDNYLVLGPANMLYRVNSTVTIATNRAYIDLNAVNPVAQAPGMRRRVIAMENIATGNLTPTLSQGEEGKVLRDGQLFILRDGKTYNAQGQIVK